MQTIKLTTDQLEIINSPFGGHTFLEGPAGAGKTTAAVERLAMLLGGGVPASSILILIPQRLLAQPYLRKLRSGSLFAGGQVTILSLGGLSRRMVELYWPLIAEAAGFAQPDLPPTFLTLETALYFMAEVARPLIDQGYFSAVTLHRNRLYSQILDNLNKAAVVGFPYMEIGDRLTDSWIGDPGMAQSYAQAQECATRFRRLCYRRNLLDYSLQIEVFRDALWRSGLARDYLVNQYRVVFADNLEEDTPAAHDVIADWLPHAQEAVLVYDRGGGFRRFLGADPEHALALREQCNQRVLFERMHAPSLGIQSFARRFVGEASPSPEGPGDRLPIHYAHHRFYPEMLEWVADAIKERLEAGVAPGEIVVLAPFLGDALRFALSYRLHARGVSTHSARPSRALRQEPAARCLLSLASLCHPEWMLPPSPHDLAQALTLSIHGLDPVRARLLADTLYRIGGQNARLAPFGQLLPEMKARITYAMGQRYEGLRRWIEAYRELEPLSLDHLLSRIFGELLSQPGYGFHEDFDAGVAAAQLIESTRSFRQIVGREISDQGGSVGQAYLRLAEESVVGLQSLPQPGEPPADSVLLAPAYTFLMNNQPVDYQFWLNIGGQGWSERLYQPLTHPYVLSRQWPRGKRWTDIDEIKARESIMEVLTQGLLRRCRKGVYLGISELSESGNEDRGPLLSVLQRILMESRSKDPDAV